MPVLRAILFYLGYVLSGIFFGTLALPLWLLPYRFRYPIINRWNHFTIFWLSCCCGIKVNIQGTLPKDLPYVVMANHQSPWETIFLQYYFEPICTILKKELLRIPFFGWGLLSLDSIAIDRGKPREAIKAVREQGQNRLSRGINVLVFPEGTRKNYGESGTYARSGADIAIASGVAVVPVAHNAGLAWPAKTFLKKPATVTVVIGEPISSEGLNSKELTKLVKHWVESNTP